MSLTISEIGSTTESNKNIIEKTNRLDLTLPLFPEGIYHKNIPSWEFYKHDYNTLLRIYSLVIMYDAGWPAAMTEIDNLEKASKVMLERLNKKDLEILKLKEDREDIYKVTKNTQKELENLQKSDTLKVTILGCTTGGLALALIIVILVSAVPGG